MPSVSDAVFKGCAPSFDFLRNLVNYSALELAEIGSAMD
jgi:hypothetical protein